MFTLKCLEVNFSKIEFSVPVFVAVELLVELVKFFPFTGWHGPLDYDWLIFKSAVGRSESG